MKTLIAPRATKGMDQAADGSSSGGGTYIPIEDRQRWTGMGISPEAGLSVLTAYQCVRIKASTYASIPTILYRRLPGGGRERAEDHPLYRTFSVAANPDMTAFSWKNLAKGHIETWGNHFSDIVTRGDGSVELWPIRPDRIEVYWDREGRKAYDYLHPTQGRRSLDPRRVLHLMAMTTDGLVGLSPITQMRRAMVLYRVAESYGESVFRNGARPATVLTHPKTLSPAAIERLGAQMDGLRGSGNAGKTVVLEEGLSVVEVGFPPEDAQFLESRLFQKREITAGFGLSTGMLNDPENREKEDEESRKFIKRTMVPDFEAFEQEVQLQVIDDDRYFVEFLVDAYLRGDPKARADAFAVRWEHGTLNADEWRGKENEAPLPDGLGEAYYRPANWVPLGEEPVAVGGDASAATQFGQTAGLVDQVTRAKAVKEVRCPSCDKLLIPELTGSVKMACYRCKADVEVAA